MNEELKKIAESTMESIAELVKAGDADAITEYPLEVLTRSGWTNNPSDMHPEEYQILLSTGGPATRIVGELNPFHEPISARPEVQDWGTPWTEYREADEEILLSFASRFWFGE